MRRRSVKTWRSVDRGTCRLGIEPRKRYETERRRLTFARKATPHRPTWQDLRGLGGVGDPMHARKHHGRESGDPVAGHWRLQNGPHGEPQKGTAMTNGSRESDGSIVSGKPSNKVRDNKRAAERVERRELAKGSPSKRNRAWTQSQTILQRELERVREASRKSLRVNTRGRSPVR